MPVTKPEALSSQSQRRVPRSSSGSPNLPIGVLRRILPVLAVGVKDEPGGLTSLLHIMAEENFDVEYMYSIFGQPNGLAYMILRVNDVAAASEMLNKHNVHIADCADLGII